MNSVPRIRVEFSKGAVKEELIMMGKAPKVELEIVLADGLVQKVLDVIIAAAKTGKITDGKVYVYFNCEAVRIRTSETGLGAV